jgi:TolB-like protein/Tfp pilus assembly protein PilF
VRAVFRLYREARRRKVFRTGALYIVGAWLALQVANVIFPGFGIPDAAIRALVWAAVLGFPLALVFGWLFELGPWGIRRTAEADASAPAEPQPLARRDYLILAAIAGIALLLAYRAVEDIRETPQEAEVAGRGDAARGAAERKPNSIAVLPFANISNDPDNGYFCDGVAEEILLKLADVRELTVIGRTSSFAFKDSDYAVDRISALLGVRYVLQGSVRKAGEQLRVSAQLLDHQGVQVWGESFDRRLENVFEIQSEIAAAVASVVAEHVLPRPVTEYQPKLEAYDHYLAGRALLHQRNGVQAREALEKAIAIDPMFAEAHAELALARVFDAEDLGAARQSLARALELNPQLLRARAIEGLMMTNQEPPDRAGAERVLREVLAQEPNMSDALNWLQSTLNEQGRAAEARAILERAYAIDPLHAAIAANFADVLHREGRIDDAARIIERQLAQPSPGPLAYISAVDLLESRGRLVELHRVARKMAEQPIPPFGFFPLAESYARLGDWDAVDAWLDRQERMWPDSPFTLGQRVLQRAWRGEFEEAVRWARAVLAERNETLADLPEPLRIGAGFHLARAGEYAAAIELLEPHLDIDGSGLLDMINPDPSYSPHALAWAYLQTGAREKAARLLAAIGRDCAPRLAAQTGQAKDSSAVFRCAQNELLMGNDNRALDLLSQAIEGGWRGYYVRQKDPFWAVLADHPRYRELMAKVKADVDRQRAEIAKVDASEDLGARVDAEYAARRAGKP